MYTCKYPNLFSPITIGNTLFRNRLFASPTGLQYATSKNRPINEGISYYERKAIGGAASVCIGDAMVDSEIALANGNHIRLDDPDVRPHLTKLSDATCNGLGMVRWHQWRCLTAAMLRVFLLRRGIKSTALWKARRRASGARRSIQG